MTKKRRTRKRNRHGDQGVVVRDKNLSKIVYYCLSSAVSILLAKLDYPFWAALLCAVLPTFLFWREIRWRALWSECRLRRSVSWDASWRIAFPLLVTFLMIFLGFQVQERDNRQVQEQKQVIPAPVEPRYADDEPSAASSTSSPEVPLEKQPFFRFEVVTVEEQDGMQSRLDIYNEGEPAFDLVVRKANYLRLHTDEGPLVLPVWFYLDATFSQESLGYLASLHSRPMPFSGRYGGDQNFLKSLLATLGRDLGESTIAAAVGAADSGRDLVVEQIR